LASSFATRIGAGLGSRCAMPAADGGVGFFGAEEQEAPPNKRNAETAIAAVFCNGPFILSGGWWVLLEIIPFYRTKRPKLKRIPPRRKERKSKGGRVPVGANSACKLQKAWKML
jgi:hypothetical protein